FFQKKTTKKTSHQHQNESVSNYLRTRYTIVLSYPPPTLLSYEIGFFRVRANYSIGVRSYQRHPVSSVIVYCPLFSSAGTAPVVATAIAVVNGVKRLTDSPYIIVAVEWFWSVISFGTIKEPTTLIPDERPRGRQGIRFRHKATTLWLFDVRFADGFTLWKTTGLEGRGNRERRRKTMTRTRRWTHEGRQNAAATPVLLPERLLPARAFFHQETSRLRSDSLTILGEDYVTFQIFSFCCFVYLEDR
ncbi:unnamed protein product, partial [Heterotrigona itama]